MRLSRFLTAMAATLLLTGMLFGGGVYTGLFIGSSLSIAAATCTLIAAAVTTKMIVPAVELLFSLWTLGSTVARRGYNSVATADPSQQQSSGPVFTPAGAVYTPSRTTHSEQTDTPSPRVAEGYDERGRSQYNAP